MSDLVYGACGAVIALVIGALVALFVRRGRRVKDGRRFWGED